jgi:hypothetical protein
VADPSEPFNQAEADFIERIGKQIDDTTDSIMAEVDRAALEMRTLNRDVLESLKETPGPIAIEQPSAPG